MVVLVAGNGGDEFTVERAAEELGVPVRAVHDRIQQGAPTAERGRTPTIFRVRNRAQAYRNLWAMLFI